MKEFSLFSATAGILNTKPTDTIELKDCADIIRASEPLINATTKLRSIQPGGEKTFGFKKNKTQKEAYKERFPYVTFSGLFSSRANDKLITHSGYICIDLDHIGKNGQIKELQGAIKENIIPSLMFFSPSGTGLKVVFAIDMNEGSHLQYYNALESFFKEKFSLDIDKACKDVSRACFLCHDPEVFFSDSPTLLNKTFIPGVMSSGTKKISTPQNDESSSYEAAKKWTNSQITFVEGSRNLYITTLAGACNRMGISEHFVSNQLKGFTTEGFTQEEIDSTIKSLYRNTQYHNAAPLSDQNPVRKQPISKPIESSPPPDGEKCPYIRVGTTYYKIIEKTDRYGLQRKELKIWTKDTIIQDFKRGYLKSILHYDDFVMVPDNINFTPFINNCYNLYSEFKHIPKKGDWTWTKYLLEHVFGEQYEQGLRYMQILYQQPERQTVILVLVSAIKQTGKTTFLNWINMLFGDNMAMLSSSDFLSSFNHYGRKNIIAIEETLFEKRLTMEKLKALATQKHITINEKYVAQYMIPFYGKIILTSNYEDKFALVDSKEIRFFVRKLGVPIHVNHAIEDCLFKEIPAFLHHLNSLPPIDWSVSRSAFSAEELKNDSLAAVVKESRHEISKDLVELINDYFNTHENLTEFYAAAVDLKNKFFPTDGRRGISWIGNALKEDLNLIPVEYRRYYPFEDLASTSKPGTPFLFKRIDICKNDETPL